MFTHAGNRDSKCLLLLASNMQCTSAKIVILSIE